MTNFGVLGAGTWGAVIAAHLVDMGHKVSMWHFIKDEAEELQNSRKHPFLKGFRLPDGLVVTSDLSATVEAGEIIINVVPSQVVRGVMEQVKPILNMKPIANFSKGIEQGTLQRMSEVIMETTGLSSDKIATVYGPSHAEEVMQKIPTTLVAASENIEFARQLQEQFSTESLRVYSNSDIVGVEIGGSVKNVIAIAAGICVGIGFGDNTMAALMTRGLAEITRLGSALGADKHTFAGLSGVGDLAVTAYSVHSRNRRLGLEIGNGRQVEEIMDEMGMVAEGLYTAKSVIDLAKKYNVEMPICAEVNKVLFEEKDPRLAITDLMTRGLRDEMSN